MIPSIQQISKKSNIKPQLIHQTQQIEKLLAELKGQSPKIKRSINWIGTAWKWIAGTPDASDWDELLKNQNKIVESNNEQYKINNALMETSQQILDDFNKIIGYFNENSQEKFEQLAFNRLLIIKEEIKEIVRAAQLAKAEIVNTNLLDREEVNRIVAEIETLPYSNEIEAIEYAEPLMLIKNSIILYVISIPKTSKINYNHLAIRSTIKNDKQIYLEHQQLLANQNDIFGITSNCRKFKETIICKINQLQEIPSNHCINQLMNGLEAGCDYQFNKNEIIEQLDENTIFLNNFNGSLVYNTTIQHLEGNILVQFVNETIQINGKLFSNKEIKISQVLPSILQNNITEKSMKVDLEYLHNLHLNNVEKLEKLFTNHKTSTVIDTCLIIIIVLAIPFGIYKILKKKHGNLKFLPRNHTKNEEITIPTGPQPITLKF